MSKVLNMDLLDINRGILVHQVNCRGAMGRGLALAIRQKPFAMALYNSGHNFLFGKIFDYELPLKERLSSRYGEIDLLSKINNEIYVIELKIGYTDSGKISETLLRAIMESFTFTKLLNIRKDKFIKDMKIPEMITFRPVILTFTNALSADHMNMLKTGQLKKIGGKLLRESRIP